MRLCIRRRLLAGMVVTALPQPGTAIASLVSSFCVGAAVALMPGLAALLGADPGSALSPPLGAERGDPARQGAQAPPGFNLAMVLLAFPLLPALRRMLERLLPDGPLGADLAAPRYLDALASHPSLVALAKAGGEALRQADALEEMPHAIAAGPRTEDRDRAHRIGQPHEVVDGLNPAVPSDLAARRPDLPGHEDRRCITEIRTFALNLESAADVLARSPARVAARPVRRSSPLTARTALHE